MFKISTGSTVEYTGLCSLKYSRFSKTSRTQLCLVAFSKLNNSIQYGSLRERKSALQILPLEMLYVTKIFGMCTLLQINNMAGCNNVPLYT